MRRLLKEFVMVETSFARPLRFLHTKELANLPPPPRRHLFFTFLICRRCRRCRRRRLRLDRHLRRRANELEAPQTLHSTSHLFTCVKFFLETPFQVGFQDVDHNLTECPNFCREVSSWAVHAQVENF